MKIWRRYILGKLVAAFFFFLSSLFAIYVLIDLSVNGVRFLSQTSFGDTALFYFYSLGALLDLFLMLAFLLAAMGVLFDLTSHREIGALQIAGISKKQLMAPFFFFAALLSFICYANGEWFADGAQEFANHFKAAHKSKKGGQSEPKAFIGSLQDGSSLIYRHFDRQQKKLFDVFWVRSSADVWHMKELDIESLEGVYANRFLRNEMGRMEKRESFEHRSFSLIAWRDREILSEFIPYERRPLSTLFLQAWRGGIDQRAVFSHLYYKLFSPLIPLLSLFSIAPFCLSYHRNKPTFLLAAYFLFGWISIKIVLDGMLVLGEHQVLPSYIAIGIPISIALGCSLPPFIRMR